MTDPRMLRAIFEETARARRVVAALSTATQRIAEFAVTLDGLPLLRAEDAFQALVEGSSFDGSMAPAVERVESAQAPMGEEAAPREGRPWREWLRPETAVRTMPTAAGVTTRTMAPPPAGISKNPAGGGLKPPDAAPVTVRTSAMAGKAASGSAESGSRPVPALVRPGGAAVATGQAAIAPSAVSRALESAVAKAERAMSPPSADRQTQRLGPSITGISEEERSFTPIRPLTAAESTAMRTGPSAAPTGLRRLASLANVADRELRVAPSAAVEPGTREEAAGVAPASSAQPRSWPPFAHGSGLRRLASIANTFAAGSTDGKVEGPQAIPPPGSQPYDPPLRIPSPVEIDFAARLAETLREEAERHGIDVEGTIR